MLQWLGDLLSPPRCAACGAGLAARAVFCVACSATVERCEDPEGPVAFGLYGGALAEIYVWGADARPYERSVPLFSSWTPTATAEWSAAVTRAYGLYWFDPFPLSSARQAHRPTEDLAGHCAHQLGHLM